MLFPGWVPKCFEGWKAEDVSNEVDIPDGFVTVFQFCVFVFVYITGKYLEPK